MAKARPRLYEKFLCLGLAVLVALGRSRSGLLALLVSIAYALIQHRRRFSLAWGLVLCAFALLFVPHSWLLNRLNIFENGGRVRIWGVALKALAERPLTGYGLGNFELAYLKYAFPIEGAVRYARTTAFAHNDYLQALSEWGWPTAGLLILGFIGVLLRPRSSHPLAAPAKAILLALGTAAFFNPVFKMPLLVLLGILAVSSLREPVDPELSTPPQDYAKGVPARLLIYMGLVGLLTLWYGIRTRWASQERYDRILKWDKKDAEAWHELAQYMKSREEMLFCHRKAVELSPFEPYYVEALARTLESFPGRDYVPEALQAYMTAIHLAPTRAVNDLAVARLLWRSGEVAHTLEWSEKALELEPYYWEAVLWKARALSALGKPTEAVFALKNLKHRQAEFQRTNSVPPRSPYEESILHYEDTVIRQELSRLRSKDANGVQ